MSQIQTTVALAIASTLMSASTVAQPSDPVSPPASKLDRTLISRNNNLKAAKPSFATVSGDRYSFTMTLPQGSVSRFAKLSFSLTKLDRKTAISTEGSSAGIVPLPFNLQNTFAQVGTGNALKGSIAVKDTFIDETGTVWVEFNSPVPAKTTLTVVFKTRKPLLTGRYAYSIAAYPQAIFFRPIFVGDGTFVAR